ncbi:hemagglutinin [Burkholderia sp. SRS-46]|nr:hemagglutinin [Burkholderia sp. SRS-46]
MRATGVSEEGIARWAVEQRNDVKVTYRDMSPPDFVQAAEARNMSKYGHPIGPTIDQLRQKGLSWQQITDSAARPSGQDMGFGK